MAHPILEHHKKLTEFLGAALGPSYEVTLHDLTDKSRSLIAIANGYISGRKIGAPLTNVALQCSPASIYRYWVQVKHTNADEPSNHFDEPKIQ